MSNSEIQETFKELVDEPEKRFKRFFEFYCEVNVNNEFSIDKYLRSGKEMLRMADIYFREKDYLHSFVLYSRYVNLYCDKIKKHIAYERADKQELSLILKTCRKTVFPRAEKLKIYLKELFAYEAKIYQQNLQEKKLKDEAASERLDEFKSILFIDQDDTEATNGQRSISTSKYNLRNLFIPSNLTSEFLKASALNTNRNVETCGVLAGKLRQNAFYLTHCIIPKQSGTSDTCLTEREDEIFNFIDKHDLLTLGWIHTHPTQTAFLSSIDMHSQYSYQIMIPESIAIVCSPKFNKSGYFNLTPDYGLKFISNCNKSGFHEHQSTRELFEEADHIQMDNHVKVDLVDLRNL